MKASLNWLCTDCKSSALAFLSEFLSNPALKNSISVLFLLLTTGLPLDVFFVKNLQPILCPLIYLMCLVSDIPYNAGTTSESYNDSA